MHRPAVMHDTRRLAPRSWITKHSRHALDRFLAWFKDHPMKVSAQIARTRP
jgi:hypothetical protein